MVILTARSNRFRQQSPSEAFPTTTTHLHLSLSHLAPQDVLLSLGRDRPTSLTTAFSGKMARGIRNSFMMHQQLPGAEDKVRDSCAGRCDEW